MFRHVDHGVRRQRCGAEPSQRRLGLPRQRRREGGQHAVGSLDQQHPRPARIDLAEVAAQDIARQLRDLAGDLDAGRAGADHDERQPRAPAVRILLQLGRLEGGEDAAADVERAGQRLQLRRVRPPLVVAEVGVARTSRHHERVVGDDGRALLGRQPVDLHLAPRQVEPRHVPEHDARVPLPAEQGAQRRRDLRRAQRAGRHLVHERLEEREVLPVDERHVDGRVAQPAHDLDAGEAAADHDDAAAAARLGGGVVRGPPGTASEPGTDERGDARHPTAAGPVACRER